MNEPHRRFLRETFLLTVATLIIKVLSITYRIPYQNIVGDVGFYIYQSVYPIYGITIVIASFGLPVALSKMISDTSQLNISKRQILTAAFTWITFFSLLMFGFTYFGAEFLADKMGDKNLALLIKTISFVCLLTPILSVLRGYFQGIQKMTPIAFSLTLEQLIRVLVIIFLSMWLLNNGADLYLVGAGAMSGSFFGGLFSLAILFLFLGKKRKTLFLFETPSRSVFLQVGKILFVQGVTFCVINMLLLFIQLADSFYIYNALLNNGNSPAIAQTLKGVYDRGQPLLQVGIVFSTALGLSIVPMLAKKNKEHHAHYIRLGMRLSIGIAFGAAIGLMSLIEPINTILFKNNFGTPTLLTLMASVFGASIIVSGAHILQSLGHTSKGVSIIFSVVLCKIFANYVAIKFLGILGAAFATVFSVSFGAMITILMLKRYTTKSLIRPFEFISLISSAAIMILFLWLFTKCFPWTTDSRLSALIEAICAAVLGATIYLICLIKLKFYAAQELQIFPLLKKLNFIKKKE